MSIGGQVNDARYKRLNDSKLGSKVMNLLFVITPKHKKRPSFREGIRENETICPRDEGQWAVDIYPVSTYINGFTTPNKQVSC